MTSQKSSEITVSAQILMVITEEAKRLGFYQAVRNHLDIPDFGIEVIKQRAIAQFMNLSTGTDDYFIARCWLKAFEELMNQSGIHVTYYFPHIDLRTH